MFDFSKIQDAAYEQMNKQMSNVGDYLTKQVFGTDSQVKTQKNPGGNLSAEQLRAGMTPVTPTIGGGGIGDYAMPIAIGLGLIVVIAFAMKK